VSATHVRLDEDRARKLLAAAAVVPTAGRSERDDALPAYNGLLDPPGVEQLGIELAARARELDPSVVLIWERPEDVALAHVVGRELGVSVVRAYDADGLVGHGPGIEAGSRVLLVADAVRDGHVVRAARALAEQLEGSLVGTAVLLATPALDEVADQAGRIVCLVQPPASSQSDAAAR
jgi:adenine/guanine phosphoribosyltransferase-like PRPP-binding protein